MFALQVFDYLNGKINKKVPARGIEFVKDRKIEFGFDKKSNPEILGATVYTNTVRFDPNAVIDLARLIELHDKKGLSYERFTAYIIQIVAHELSHLEQDIDQKKFCDDLEYAMMIEITNELRTRKWIKSHYRKMMKIFDVKFDYKWAFSLSAYLQENDSKGYGYKAEDYIAVPDIHTKLFRDIDCIFECDIVPIFQEALERGYKDIHIEYYKLKKNSTIQSLKPDVMDFGSIEVLLTDDSRAYTFWEVLHRLMIGTYKSFVVAISPESDSIGFVIMERPRTLPYNIKNPMGMLPVKLGKDKKDKWIDKYIHAKAIDL
jgi:hypothetical protein